MHYCHVHPLGHWTTQQFWCGHSCEDKPCRLFMAVWLLRHPQYIRRARS